MRFTTAILPCSALPALHRTGCATSVRPGTNAPVPTWHSVMSLGWRHPHKTALLAALFLLGAVVACAVVCHAQRGRWRPQADDTAFGFDFDFDFGVCPAGLTGRALLLFLTSPPRMFLDGGVRNGLGSGLCASGQASRAPARSAGAQCAYARFAGCAGGVRGVWWWPGQRGVWITAASA